MQVLQQLLSQTCNVKVGLASETTATRPPSMGDMMVFGTVQGRGLHWRVSLTICEPLHCPQSSQDTDVPILENQTLCLKVHCCTELIMSYVTIKKRSGQWMAVSLSSEREVSLSLPCAEVLLFGLVLSDTCIGRIFRCCYLYLYSLLFHFCQCINTRICSNWLGEQFCNMSSKMLHMLSLQ
jgi:hypothetical protein